MRVLPFDVGVAARHAAVRAAVEGKSRSKTDFDLVIACTALEHGATLITNDAALEDGAIEDLVVEDWPAGEFMGRLALLQLHSPLAEDRGDLELTAQRLDVPAQGGSQVVGATLQAR